MKTARQSPEMTRFSDALRQVMQVSKPQLNALLKDEKAIESVRQKRGPRPKTSASGRESREKG
jgi:hypothetical protein